MLNIAVDKAGKVWFQKQQVSLGELGIVISNRFRVDTNLPVYVSGERDTKPASFPYQQGPLATRYSVNPNLPVYITGTRDATHGSVMYVLDFVKRAGIQRVAIAVKAAPGRS